MEITRLKQPLGRTRKRKLATVLASAFGQDTAMINMMGEARWHKIAFRYFYLQLNHPDGILIAKQKDQIVGTLLASSPVSSPPSLLHIKELLSMMWLMGNYFKESQRIAGTVGSALPRKPIWYINQLAVLPELQSQGIGQKLLKAFEEMTGHFPVYVDCEHELESYYQAAGYTLMTRTSAALSIMARGEPATG